MRKSIFIFMGLLVLYRPISGIVKYQEGEPKIEERIKSQQEKKLGCLDYGGQWLAAEGGMLIGLVTSSMLYGMLDPKFSAATTEDIVAGSFIGTSTIVGAATGIALLGKLTNVEGSFLGSIVGAIVGTIPAILTPIAMRENADFSHCILVGMLTVPTGALIGYHWKF
jgi:ethanolamine transporter EutH